MSHFIQKLLLEDLQRLEARYSHDAFLQCIAENYKFVSHEESSSHSYIADIARLKKLNDDLCAKIQELTAESSPPPSVRTISMENLSPQSFAAMESVRALREQLEREAEAQQKQGSETSDDEKKGGGTLEERLALLESKFARFKRRMKKRLAILEAL